MADETTPFQRPLTPREQHNARVAARAEAEEDYLYITHQLQRGSPAYIRAATRASHRIGAWVDGRIRSAESASFDRWAGKLAQDLLGLDASSTPEEKAKVIGPLVEGLGGSDRTR